MSHIVCDEKRCSGCLACVVACIDKHYPETCPTAVSGRIYEPHVSPETGMTCYHTRSCLHCQNPECIKVCPTDALYDTGKGCIGLNQELCVGCKACASACPHDMIRFDGAGHAMKCNGCADRVAEGLEPLCVKICPSRALKLI